MRRETGVQLSFRFVRGKKEAERLFSLLRELTPTLTQERYAKRVRAALETNYRLVVGMSRGKVVCVAGYRILETLSWGRILFVDDLVTAPDKRSQGFGSAMIDRLAEIANDRRCCQIQLESGASRRRAHAFYRRHGFESQCLRFFKGVSR